MIVLHMLLAETCPGSTFALLAWGSHRLDLASGWARQTASQNVTGKFWKDPVSNPSLWAEGGDAAMEGLPQLPTHPSPGELGISDGTVVAKGPFVCLVSIVSRASRILKRRDWGSNLVERGCSVW